MYNYTWHIPLTLSPLADPPCPLLVPFYLLGTLLAVTGSVHLSPRLLVNWPSLTQPFSPHPPPSKFPESQSPRASLRGPQDQSDIFCRAQEARSSAQVFLLHSQHNLHMTSNHREQYQRRHVHQNVFANLGENIQVNTVISSLKGTVALDFSALVFIIKSVHLGPWFIS